MPLHVGLAAKSGLVARCGVEGRIMDDLLPPLNDIRAQRGDYWRFMRPCGVALRAAVI
jgi:hypothetical protein